MTGLWLVSYIALWILFLIVAVTVLSILRNIGIIYNSLPRVSEPNKMPTKLSLGSTVPDITLQTLSGKDISLSALSGASTAFAIVSPQCAPCRSLVKQIATTNASIQLGVQKIILVSAGDPFGTTALLQEAKFPQNLQVLVDPEGKLLQEWGIPGTPTIVIVDDHLKFVRHTVGFAGESDQDEVVLARV